MSRLSKIIIGLLILLLGVSIGLTTGIFWSKLKMKFGPSSHQKITDADEELKSFKCPPETSMHKTILSSTDDHKHESLSELSCLNSMDRKEGRSVTFWPTGHKRSESTFEDGLKLGRYVQWFENGVKESEIFYKPAGKFSGKLVRYWSNGKKRQEGEADRDFRTGPWKTWYESGQLQLEENYVDHELSGEMKIWHENGTIQTIGFYKKNQPVGIWKEFDEKGQLIKETDISNPPADIGDEHLKSAEDLIKKKRP